MADYASIVKLISDACYSPCFVERWSSFSSQNCGSLPNGNSQAESGHGDFINELVELKLIPVKIVKSLMLNANVYGSMCWHCSQFRDSQDLMEERDV